MKKLWLCLIAAPSCSANGAYRDREEFPRESAAAAIGRAKLFLEGYKDRHANRGDGGRLCFALCKRTNSVYYFGEDVDIYKNGKIVGHEGSWLSGEKGAKFG